MSFFSHNIKIKFRVVSRRFWKIKSRNPILTENEYVIILKQIPRDMRQTALDILFQSNLDLKLLDFPALP